MKWMKYQGLLPAGWLPAHFTQLMSWLLRGLFSPSASFHLYLHLMKLEDVFMKSASDHLHPPHLFALEDSPSEHTTAGGHHDIKTSSTQRSEHAEHVLGGFFLFGFFCVGENTCVGVCIFTGYWYNLNPYWLWVAVVTQATMEDGRGDVYTHGHSLFGTTKAVFSADIMVLYILIHDSVPLGPSQS